MKTLEKKVHFKAEGTSIGCYDPKGNSVGYIFVSGTPHIALEHFTDRLLKIDSAVCSSSQDIKCYNKYPREAFVHVGIRAVVNGNFITSSNSTFRFAWRECSDTELASFHLAMYKAYKNAIKTEVKNG